MKTIYKFILFCAFLSVVFGLALAVPGITLAQYTGCTYHSYQSCSGPNLYWYNSCGQQQDLAQYCSNGCYNSSCNNNYNNYSSCTNHAYRLCVGNTNIYWYNSCGNQQDLYLGCTNGQVCNSPNQYGQCATYVPPPVEPTYIAHYRTACYANSIHWYDSLGVESGLYKNCNDNNACTTDTCSTNICMHTLIANCPTVAPPQEHCGNGLCEITLNETNTNCPNDCKINTPVTGLSVSFFTKQDSSSTQWQKSAQVNSNSKAYFMISVANTSTAQIDNVTILASIPSEISSLGNLQLNGVPVSGDIVSGISIGSLSPASAKSITFEGITQTISANSTKQATATVSVQGQQSGQTNPNDSISMSFNTNQAAGGVSGAPATSGFLGFLKQWYLWILAGLVLVFLFIVVFKRFSSEV